jgi:hypothetical protein
MPPSSEADVPLGALSKNTGALNNNDNSFNRDQSHQNKLRYKTQHDNAVHTYINNHLHSSKVELWHVMLLVLLALAIIGVAVGVPVGLKSASQSKGKVGSIF